jgi:RNA polymerase sigma-70 factor (ECF subfamily)
MADDTNRRAGNRADDAEEAWWELLSERLVAIARRRGLSVDDAGDVVQETLRDALQALDEGKFAGSGSREGWVYGIFRHKLGDFRRGAVRSGQRLLPVDILAESADRSLMARESPRVSPEELAIVHDALAQLPPRERAALILKEQYGYVAREFAPLLGVSRRTASDILTRAGKLFAEICSAGQKTDPLKRLKK